MGAQPLDEFLNTVVVLDTHSPFVYIGTLDGHDALFITLRDATVHDCRESPITREQHVSEAKRFGFHASRKQVKVKVSDLVSLSRLDDVITN